MIHETDTYADQRQHEIETEQVSSNKLSAPVGHTSAPNTTNIDFCLISEEIQGYSEVDWPRKVEEIVYHDWKGYDKRLADFGPVDTSEDIDAVRCERR